MWFKYGLKVHKRVCHKSTARKSVRRINLKSNENEKRNTQENSEFRHYRSHRRSLCLLCAELPVVSTL